MRTSDSITNIAKALAAAQGEMKNPEANETVIVKMKDGGSYSYQYATLPKCFDAARAPFAKNGLSHTAAIVLTDRGADLVVRVTHESGEWYESSVPLAGGGDAKARAGEITFWKRYLFNGLAGIAGDDDIRDGDGERGPSAQNGAHKAAPKSNAANAPKTVQKPAPASGTFDAQDAPPLRRARGLVVKEIMDAARRIGIGQDLTPPDVVAGLEVRAAKMFAGKHSRDLNEDELERLLQQLNSEGTGK